MAGLAGQAAVSGSPSTTLVAFVVAAVVLVTLMFTAAIGVALAKDKALKPLRTAGPAVRRWGGTVLLVVGLWFIVLALAG